MSPPSGLEPPSERIGRYQVVERIGRGAMGVVYSARDEVMDRAVAIKVMTADLEAAQRNKTRMCITVIVDDGPVRWFVGQQRQRTAR